MFLGVDCGTVTARIAGALDDAVAAGGTNDVGMEAGFVRIAPHDAPFTVIRTGDVGSLVLGVKEIDTIHGQRVADQGRDVQIRHVRRRHVI